MTPHKEVKRYVFRCRMCNFALGIFLMLFVVLWLNMNGYPQLTPLSIMLGIILGMLLLETLYICVYVYEPSSEQQKEVDNHG